MKEVSTTQLIEIILTSHLETMEIILMMMGNITSSLKIASYMHRTLHKLKLQVAIDSSESNF